MSAAMPEINLGSVDPAGRPVDSGDLPDPERRRPDLLGFGPEPSGDAPDRAGVTGWVGRYLRLVPARWRRPLPRSLVALASALVTATVVVLYLDRPDDPPALAPEPARLLSPESWLDVQEGGYPFQFDPTGEQVTRVEAARSRHPADAIVAVPLSPDSPSLLGLPPGAYQVRASCSLAVVPVRLTGPLLVTVNVREPADRSATLVAPDVACDGAAHLTHERLVFSGYRAYFAEGLFVFDQPVLAGEEDPYTLVTIGQPVIVVSFTRVD